MDSTVTVPRSLHAERFPNETAAYRAARDELLLAERELRRQVEAVAELRRALPPGGEVPQDYLFESETGPVRLSELFGDKDTLAAYSFMYGPKMEHACPSCTSMLDGLDGQAPHITQRIALAIIAKSPIARIRAHADTRGWRRLRLLSSANNGYNRDYHGESEDGSQLPMLNIFVRRGGKVVHTWASELAFAPREPGQDPRHIDMIWPLWNMLDFTPSGRGVDWRPKLGYDG
jgi:predicted dithiol-disulfide oxidoreductase (DUF899 family)